MKSILVLDLLSVALISGMSYAFADEVEDWCKTQSEVKDEKYMVSLDQISILSNSQKF